MKLAAFMNLPTPDAFEISPANFREPFVMDVRVKNCPSLRFLADQRVQIVLPHVPLDRQLDQVMPFSSLCTNDSPRKPELM